MGACISTPQAPNGADYHNPSVDCKAYIIEQRLSATGHLHSSPSQISSLRTSSDAAHTLLQVQELQNALAAVSDAPGLGLSEAAELLHMELDASLVSIYGLASTSDGAQPPTAVLLAAHGSGVGVLERHPVVTDESWSCLQLRGGALECLTRCTTTNSAEDDQGRPLPQDWQLLQREAGMRCFLAVPIGPAAKPWGVLTIANETPESLDDAKWRVWPSVAAVALVHQVRHWQTVAMCSLLRELSATEDRVALIGVLLRATSSFMERAINAHTGVRLAVLDKSCSKALLFELRGGQQQQQQGPRVPCGGDSSPLIASEVDLKGTLLSSAVSMRKARFIRDCACYMQSSLHPARDIFTQPAQLVSALVVVPLVHGEGPPMAALYLTLEAPNDFTEVQQPLLGLISGIMPALRVHLESHLDSIWEEAQAVRNHSSRMRALRAEGSVRGGDQFMSPHIHLEGDDRSFSCDSLPAACAEAPSSRLQSCNGKRLCTGAMIKVVEQEILKSKRRSFDPPATSRRSSATTDASDSFSALSQQLPAASSELVLAEMIGSGGYGTVWRGAWKKVTAAIKVMHERGCEQEAMMDAVEMAVLSTVSHPHIVQLYACLTDMVETTGMAANRSSAELGTFHHRSVHGGSMSHHAGPLRPPQYRQLLPYEDSDDTETCSIVVMEYCDLGSLRRVAQHGAFHRRLGGGTGPVAVDMAALVEVALQVAEAVSHLHHIRLCHCDIKLDNVLLKSELSQPRGYIAKLSDFGLAKVLGASDAVVNITCAGTVNHLAPELFVPGSCVTTAVDAYAFGIMMYELYMGGANAYAGLPKQAIIDRVSIAAMRPHFPSSAPPPYVEVAGACWAQDPASRPSFDTIIEALQGILQLMAPPLLGYDGAGM